MDNMKILFFFYYQCFDLVKKCVYEGSNNDCNTMKSKECKG